MLYTDKDDKEEPWNLIEGPQFHEGIIIIVINKLCRKGITILIPKHKLFLYFML